MSQSTDLSVERRRYELIERLVELPAREQEAVLAESDPELARDVREMLAADEEAADDFLANPAVEPAEVLPPAIGGYRLIECLGEGGMGRVFLAEQSEPVRRRVALKVLRFAAAGREARARFAAERHAMGRLDHPNVGKILEAGTTPDGLPFFVMELIDGLPITTYCDRHELPLEDRLRLFVDVCRGADHAHHKLLLHRDLKPSNILVARVDGQAVPKIIDFGIAKGLDAALADATLATGDRPIGTPGYMSPEALGLGGDVDTRSDVFSLGVLLYELLTGSRPWPEEETPLEVLKRRDDAAPRPSTRVTTLDAQARGEIAERRGVQPAELPRRLRGDLDWITLKAIAHEKSQRYGSAADLAEDIARFLADEPVTAHAPTAGYLLRKLVRRHRGRVIAGALVALSLVLGIVGTSVGLVRARAEAERANREAAAARRAQLSSDQLATYLEDLFGEADTSLENPAELTARQILERGVAGLESRLHDQPGKRAVLLHKLGEIYTRWDDFTTAEGLLTESLALLEAQRPGALADRLDVLETLADLRYEEGRYAEALELAERALGLSSDDSLATARLLIRAALAQQMSNRLDAAERRLAESLELLDRLPAETPGRLDVLGRTYLGLGSVAQNRKNRPDLERGLDYTRQALAALEAAHGEESRQLVPALNNLAYLLVDTNRLGEAEATLRRSLELEERLLGESLSVARSQYLLGRVLNKQGKYPQAEQAFRRCVEIRRKLSPEPHPLHANALALLAYAIYVQRDGRTSEVETLFEEAEAVMRGREIAYPVFSAVMGLRARVDSGEGRPAAAEAHLRRSVAWLESLEDPPLRHISTVTMRLAETLLAQGRVEDAREACRESLRTAEQGAVANYVDRRKQELEALGCL